MPDKTKVSTGKPKITGAVFGAPVGSTLPTTATENLDVAFKDLGYISEDGLSNNNSPTKEPVKEWGGAVVATIQTERPDTFAFTFLESENADVLKMIYGPENVIVGENGSISIAAKPKDLGSYAWVFDMLLMSGKAKRIVVPSASITEIGEIHYTAINLIQYNVTIMAEVDGSGNYHYEYIE